jgi:BspA type Leucine rich repeat region (6 copies)
MIAGVPVTSINDEAFFDSSGLTAVTIPNSITSIGDFAFYGCSSLTGVYFQGNAPTLGGTYVFHNVNAAATAYYLSGTTGWGPTYGGLPTMISVP